MVSVLSSWEEGYIMLIKYFVTYLFHELCFCSLGKSMEIYGKCTC